MTGPRPLPALPVDEAIPDLLAALASAGRAVLAAPPGAGKTTRVPPALLDAPWLAGRKIVMLEPRRLAARAAADRIAAERGERVGDTVGIRVRMDTRVSARTRIEIVTEGVFTRMILDDPTLDGIGAVLFDEFHERSLDGDLGLAFALESRAAFRDDLRILAMSATLDTERVSALLGGAPVIRSEGRAFPVETRYRPRRAERRIEQDVTDAALSLLADEPGSILAFLPGTAEIRRTATLLEERLAGRGVEVAPLYGTLDRAAQDRAIRPARAPDRKVVLATSIAETSLTIDGVRVVIDSGLARVPVYEPDLGLTRLETVRVSRASADQRRGRAGRTEPGLCLRLWEEASTGSLEAYSRPEILHADLAPLILDCAEWGLADPTTLPLLDPPPAPALAEARALLVDLSALDEAGRITDLGRRLRALPLPPRLARMVVSASEPREAAVVAALLTERGAGGDAVDLEVRQDRLRRDGGRRSTDLLRMADGWARTAAAQRRRSDGPTDAAGVGALVALAYPDRIAAARGRPGSFVMANGRGASLPEHEALAREPFLAVAEIAGGAASARIVAAARIDRAAIEALAGDRIAERLEIVYDPEARALRARRTRRFGAVRLSERSEPVPASPEAAATLARGLPIALLPWTPALRQWRERVIFLRSREGDAAGWPDLSDDALARTAEEWLAAHLIGRTALTEISADDLRQALAAFVPWDLQARLDREAPTHVEVPTGSRIAVDYGAEGGPVLAVRVQELFGLRAHPTLAGGRAPLLLHLLSPAGRPIQVTRDLPAFWAGSWAEVRSAMRGRYPRHPWPEDPAAAEPTSRAKPRA